IRPDAVLSAAHCVDKMGTVRVTVILGAHNMTSRERTQQKIRVGQWVIHPEYQSSPHYIKNDIVLLKLKPRARINQNVQFISIPRRNEHVRPGTLCRVSGWGRTSDKGNRSNVLREVKLKVQKEEICQQLFNNYQRQSMICVGDEYSKKATYR
ncbi:granzyme B(G,H)-like, partial [Onychostruthus taczanowskii]|uniref:granzyme B(G,H)-like n=1 Tax=Onychostruthus taczanowskii TaxID=356909 RepID=UPI001B8010CE